jgi:hypothetical protein
MELKKYRLEVDRLRALVEERRRQISPQVSDDELLANLRAELSRPEWPAFLAGAGPCPNPALLGWNVTPGGHRFQITEDDVRRAMRGLLYDRFSDINSGRQIDPPSTSPAEASTWRAPSAATTTGTDWLLLEPKATLDHDSSESKDESQKRHHLAVGFESTYQPEDGSEE